LTATKHASVKAELVVSPLLNCF